MKKKFKPNELQDDSKTKPVSTTEKREEIQKIFSQAKNGAKEIVEEKKKEEVKQETIKEVKQTQQAAEKVPLLFMTEINNNLGKTAIGLIKEALKKLKLGQISDIDLFTKEVSNNLLIFFQIL